MSDQSVEIASPNRMLALGDEVYEGEEEWKNDRNCLGLPEESFVLVEGDEVDEAKRVCRGCMVREDCLDYAIATRQKYGVWGGTGEEERKQIVKLRRRNKGRSKS